jgi:hypothetical protein
MADDNRDQSVDDNQVDDTPEDDTIDLSAMQKQLEEQFNKRFSGLQSILDQRQASIDELKAMVETLKTANLSPEEQEQLTADKREAELAALKRENEILKMRKDFPEEVDFLQKFLGSTSLEEQFKALRDFKKPKEDASPKDDDDSEEAPPVSSNNSKRKTSVSTADLAGEMNEKLAQKLLEDTKDEPGALVRLRRGVIGR